VDFKKGFPLVIVELKTLGSEIPDASYKEVGKTVIKRGSIPLSTTN
jgi:hypothetical protein